MDKSALEISTASSGSAKLQSKFILRDTLGPTSAGMARSGSEASSSTSSIKELTAWDEKGLNRSFRAIQMGKFESNSQIADQGPLAEEDSSDINNSEENSMNSFDIEVDVLTAPTQTHEWSSSGLRIEKIRKIEDQGMEGRGTPSSTASSHSGSRIIFGKDGKKTTFSPGAFQPTNRMKPTTEDQIEVNAHSVFVPVNHKDISQAKPLPNQLNKTTRDFLRGGRQNPEPAVLNHVDVTDPSQETTPKTPYTEETTPKTPYTEGASRTHEPQEEKSGNCRCLMRCAILCICVAVLVAATVLLLVYFKRTDPPPVPQTEKQSAAECLEIQKVNFTDQVVFSCTFNETVMSKLESTSSVVIEPPPYYNQGEDIQVHINNTQKDAEWVYYLNKTSGMMIYGPNATCSSSGRYSVIFKDNKNTTLHTVSLTLEVISEVSKVNVSLRQDTEGKNNAFKISCSTNSGCQQSFVDFFAEINEKETYIRGVNFSCEISYNDYHGYSVTCEGIIPDFLMKEFTKVICRPRTELLENADKETKKKFESEVELPECDLTKNCGYKCQNYSQHYFTVDKMRCDIYHQCVGETGYSGFCSPGTFFNPVECACDHSKVFDWCRSDGLNYNSELGQDETWCDVSMKTTQPMITNTVKPSNKTTAIATTPQASQTDA